MQENGMPRGDYSLVKSEETSKLSNSGAKHGESGTDGVEKGNCEVNRVKVGFS